MKLLSGISGMAALAALFVFPMIASAVFVLGSINVDSLTTTSTRPILLGMAFGVETVQIEITKEGSSKVLFTSEILKVENYHWIVWVSEELSEGTYEVMLMDAKKGASGVLTTGTLTVRTEAASGQAISPQTANADTTLFVNTVPLLSGGTTRSGMAVPVSYLQITNIGKKPATLSGFWVKQNGSASVQSVIGLTTVDDKGGSRGSTTVLEGITPFVNGSAFAPTSAVFEPGQMRLFTIKALLSSMASTYAGQNLMIDVTGIDANSSVQGNFPLRGTTWVITN